MRDRRRFQLVGAVCAALAMIVSTGAPAAQLPTGAQDLSAVWWATAYNPRIRPIEGGELPFTEAGAELYRKNMEDLRAGRREDAARVWCVYDGIPRIWQAPYPFQIIQTPGQTTIVYETNQSFRIIEMDKALPKDDDLLPNFFANSVGRWEGGTLVVESKGYKDSSFIDATGVPVSDQLRTTERFRKVSDTQLEVTVTVEDAEIFTRAWTARFVFQLRPDIRLDTYVCGEPHRDLAGIAGAAQWQ